MIDRRLTLTVAEAAELLGLSRRTAYVAAQRNELPGAFTIGTRRFVSRTALEAFLATAGKLGDQHKDGARAK
jgi:excisionase family DNA binding protein